MQVDQCRSLWSWHAERLHRLLDNVRATSNLNILQQKKCCFWIYTSNSPFPMFKVSVYHTHTLGRPRPKMIFMKGFNFLFWGKVMYGLGKKGLPKSCPRTCFSSWTSVNARPKWGSGTPCLCGDTWEAWHGLEEIKGGSPMLNITMNEFFHSWPKLKLKQIGLDISQFKWHWIYQWDGWEIVKWFVSHMYSMNP